MTDWIPVSTTAAEQWHGRTESAGIGPIVAWNEAERRNVPELARDEIVIIGMLMSFLPANGPTLVTVIDATTARLNIQRQIYGEASTLKVQ